MIMVKMQTPGITIEVPENEVNFYQRAGYSVVVETPAPVEPVKQVETPAPVEPKSKKKN